MQKFYKVLYTRKLSGSDERLLITGIIVTEMDYLIIKNETTRFDYKLISAEIVSEEEFHKQYQD